jgi:multiple sugar transport system ATP-binding protein
MPSRMTTVYVTHDQVEAMTMGDRVAVMRDGILQQCDVPRALYDRPANAFVAGFIGSPAMNLTSQQMQDGAVTVLGERVSLSSAQRERLTSTTVTVGARPDAIALTVDAEAAAATVETVEELGNDAYAYCQAALGQEPQVVVVRVDPRHPPERGSVVRLRVDREQLHFFAGESGARLPETKQPRGSGSRADRGANHSLD